MLNDARCRNAKAKEKPYKLADGKGLYLEVKRNGVKAWRYRFELGRKESVFAVGEYGVAPAGETSEQAAARKNAGRFTLAEAREERTRARALVKQGINPAHKRQLDRITREHENATSFEAVAREWLALKDWEQVTKDRRLAMLKREVFPRIGSLPVKQITPAHVLDILKATARNAPTVAAEARRTMSGVFDLAISTLRAEADPVFPVRKALPANKTQHKLALSSEEIGRLLRDLVKYERNFQTTAAFRLMWLTLCRPNEAMGARWGEFNLNAAIWRIPADRMKKRQEHVIPLPWQAVELLRTMHGLSGHRERVFPNRDDRTKPMSDATMRQALKYLGWSGKYSPHATRTTGSTRLNEMGYPADWIERQLAHTEPNVVRRTYNRADHLRDRARMMQQWADLLDLWRDGTEVVPLRSAAA